MASPFQMNVKANFRQYFLWFAIATLTIFLFLFIFRTPLTTWYVQKKVHQFNMNNRADLHVEKLRIRWLTSGLLTGISLRPESGDTLMKIDSISVSVNDWKLLFGRVVLKDLELKNFRLTVVRHDSVNNYAFLFRGRKEKDPSDSLNETLNYANASDRLTGFIFDKIPGWINIERLNISGNTNGHIISCHVEHLGLENRRFNFPLILKEDTIEQNWMVEGRIDRSERSLMACLYPINGRQIEIPFIHFKWNADVRFDTLSIRLAEQKNEDDFAVFTGSAALKNLRLNHSAISMSELTFDTLSLDYRFNVGSNFAELDSSTIVTFNRLKFNPYVRYQHKPEKKIDCRINKPPFPAEDLFSSFPPGLFTTLEGVKTKGDLSFRLQFSVNLSIPDSLKFDCELKRHQFSVLSYGTSDLTRINEPFLYTAYEKGEAVRTFIIGPENPNFRQLEKIPSFLQFSVLTSEDPGFFQHRGFLQDAFRESIIQDIREKRFARGGSTISMQLVKNVFLSRNKTIGRKLEEALIVWLIENQNLSTKERMFEIYLNAIEWGPLIYGAQEASKFYFNKEVSRLTLAESIYLASIIPKPKWFKYSFEENGHLKASQSGYFRLLSEKMLSRGWIDQKDFDQLIPDVELKGKAKFLLKNADSIPVDSLTDQE